MRKNDRKQERVPSLAIGADWDMIEEFDLAQLLKLQANIPKVEELQACGHMDQYDENYDKINSRTVRPLRKVDNKFFCDVTTTQDPVLDRLAVEQVGDVYATDAILAHLMAAPRSVYR
jgi:translation initiation factor 3 subunit D